MSRKSVAGVFSAKAAAPSNMFSLSKTLPHDGSSDDEEPSGSAEAVNSEEFEAEPLLLHTASQAARQAVVQAAQAGERAAEQATAAQGSPGARGAHAFFLRPPC